MKTKSVIIILGISITLSCKYITKTDKPQPNKTENYTIKTEPVKSLNHSYYNRVLTSDGITSRISASGEGSIGMLSIQITGIDIQEYTETREISGRVMNAEIEDLNSDGFPEVLVYTQSTGSGSYGNVIGYSVNGGKSISQIYFPSVAENNKVYNGYMGHDTLYINGHLLVQEFPIYKDGDTNSKPTGGTRRVQYMLSSGESTHVFKIYKISERKE